MSIKGFLSHAARFLLLLLLLAGGMGIIWYLDHTLTPREFNSRMPFVGFLGLLALLFLLIGYLLRVLYASRGNNINDTLQKIQRSLENSERSAQERAASQAVAIPAEVVETLKDTADQLHRIQKMIMHLGISIERLHQAKETVRTQPTAESRQPPVIPIQSERGDSTPPSVRPASSDPNTGSGEVPSPVPADPRPWRKNLNRILDRIDEGEEE